MKKIAGAGPVPAKIIIVGEGPGKEEELAGRAFAPRGKSARELKRYLFKHGILLEECRVTNLVKYRVPNDGDPKQSDIDRDAPELIQEIGECQPEFLITVGRFSTRFFLGDVDMEVCHGIPRRIDFGLGPITCVPVYHPAAGLHNTEMQGLIAWDFEQVGLAVKGAIGPVSLEDKYPNPLYFEESKIGEWHAQDLAVDTESYKGKPWGLTATLKEGVAIATLAKDVKPNIFGGVRGNIILHNSLHDLNILRKMGVEVPEDRFVDTMIMAYLLCLEPQGLKPLAKRYCGMDMKDFDEVVAPYSLNEALTYLRVATSEDNWPQAEGGKHSIYKRMKRLLSDSETGKIKANDLWRRWNSWPDELKAPVIKVMGELPDLNIFHVPMNEAIDYACRDADATLRIYPILRDKIKAMGLEEVAKMDHAVVPMVDRMQTVGMKVDFAHFSALEERLNERMESLLADIEDMVGVRINPNSGDQVADLLFRGLNLKPTKMTKGGKRESTEDKVLETIRGSHPIVPLICDYREVSKLQDSFCGVLPNLCDSDGRIRCNLRITRVSSGRLAASSPNLLAIPTRTDLGKEIRRGFVAEDGFKLVSFDLDQVEMRMMAHESEDEKMIELFHSGKDIHRETGAMIYKIKPEEVTTTQRYAAKRVGFGVITGITAKGLLDQMYLAGAMDWTEPDCQRAIDRYFEVYPAVRAYMDAKRSEARRYGFVRDMWGRIRYLPGVWSEISMVREEALRQSHSHSIQGGAQGLIKTSMKYIWDYLKHLWDGGVRIEPLLQVHDELLFEAEESIDLVVLEEINYLMSEATKLLVPIRAKWEVGDNWGELK